MRRSEPNAYGVLSHYSQCSVRALFRLIVSHLVGRGYFEDTWGWFLLTFVARADALPDTPWILRIREDRLRTAMLDIANASYTSMYRQMTISLRGPQSSLGLALCHEIVVDGVRHICMDTRRAAATVHATLQAGAQRIAASGQSVEVRRAWHDRHRTLFAALVAAKAGVGGASVQWDVGSGGGEARSASDSDDFESGDEADVVAMY